MKLFKAPVLFAFFAALLSFTAMASLGDTVSAGGNTISTAAPAPQAKEGDLNLRAVEAAERSATAAEDEANTNFWILGTTFLALVAAAFAAHYSKQSADAAIKAVKDNEKFNKYQTRAYVDVTDLKCEEIQSREPIKFYGHLKNSGTTPAYNIKLITDVFFTDEDPDHFKCHFKKGITPEFKLLPGSSNKFEIYYKDGITKCDILDLKNCRKFLIVSGYCKYYDIFRRLHRMTLHSFVAYISIDKKDCPVCLTPKHNISN